MDWVKGAKIEAFDACLLMDSSHLDQQHTCACHADFALTEALSICIFLQSQFSLVTVVVNIQALTLNTDAVQTHKSMKSFHSRDFRQ